MAQLKVFMGGLIASGQVTSHDAEILSRLWIAGVIPLFVGIALMINGVVVSKKIVEAAQRELPAKPERSAADTNDFSDSPFSVTEQTTKQLGQ